MQRGRLKGKACRNNRLVHGAYGIQALEPVWLTSSTSKKNNYPCNKTMEYGSKFFQISLTARVEESRMGSGKGAVDYWVVVIKPGNIIFELAELFH